jgi:integrase/recombinase XerD
MRAVNIRKKCKTEKGWIFLPLAKNAKGFVNGGLVVVDGAAESKEGTYYLDWYENGKRIQKAIGPRWSEAINAQRQQVHVLALRKAGNTDIKDAIETTDRGIAVPKAIAEYLQTAPINLAVKSFAKYKNALLEFKEWISKHYVSQVHRDDIVAFMRHVMQTGRDASTATDKAVIVITVMRQYGAAIKMQKGDWPTVDKQEIEVYEDDELRTLFEDCGEENFELFQFFRLTGFRHQEVAFCSWPDFNARRGTVAVTRKMEMGFRPKNHEERTIPIPGVLVDLLKTRKERYPDDYLIFPTGHRVSSAQLGGQPDFKMLDTLKRLVWRKGLNCGRCKATVMNAPVTCKTHPVCKHWGLHKFRHTYATNLLHDGVDILSLQRLLGHKDQNSTMVYLKARKVDEMKLIIEKTRLSSLTL